MESDQRLLSTQQQHQVYALYDAEDLLLLTPNSNRWYPESKTRINAQYLFYFIAFCSSVAGLVWPVVRYGKHPFFLDNFQPITWGSHFVYFAYWMLILHAFFYFLAAVDLRLRYYPISTYVHSFKERVYDTTFSLTVLQFVVFWAFVFTERVKHVSEGTLTWEVWCIDLLQNLCPFVFIAIETAVVHHRFAEGMCQIFYEVIFSIIIYAAYVLFSHYAHRQNHHWPYPIQNRTQNHQGLILFYVCGGLVLILGYVAAKTITRFLWRDQDGPKENPEDVLHSSFTTNSVFSSFTNQGNVKHYIQPQHPQQQYVAESLVVGSPQTSYNGYGTVDHSNNGKGYY